MVEHTIFLDLMGGTKVLSCEALGIKNIEYPYGKVTEEGIKDAILKYKHIAEEGANFDLVVINNIPPAENYNEVKNRESKEFKKSRNDMKAAKM